MAIVLRVCKFLTLFVFLFIGCGGGGVSQDDGETGADREPAVTPEITISGGNAVTEGASATFSVTAYPAPAAPLDVTLRITQIGDFVEAGSLGVKTVTVPVTGSVSHTVSTTDDNKDESNGSVTAAIRAGGGYTVGPGSSATVTVNDDDGTVVTPEVSISGGSAVTEGAAASFDITVVPAPSRNLSVSLNITQSGNFLRSGQGGVKSVTVGSVGSTTRNVLTEDDENDEADGSVTATIRPDAGYTVGTISSATVTVKDNDLPHIERISLPSGFSISFYSDSVPGARSLAMGTDGTLFVGTRGSGFVYALKDNDGDNRAESVRVILSGLNTPNGVAFRNGDLYVAEINRILRYDDIEDNLSNPPAPVVITNRFPTNLNHGWKFIRFGPDGKLYVPVGAPCNVCSVDETTSDISYAAIMRMDPDGSDIEIFARGVRNTVGFDWHPTTNELWFTDNGRDNIDPHPLMNDNKPPDELNHASSAGLHFGFPYCHGADLVDPAHGSDQKPCSDFTAPKQNLGPHVAALGMRFYTGSMFPSSWKNVIFIAEHGSWNRTVPIGYRVTYVTLNQAGDTATSYKVFAEGWLSSRGTKWGRPVDVLVAPDGALIVSDDERGAVYRISR